MLLEQINDPTDLKALDIRQLGALCKELKDFYIKTVSETGGHLGASLGVLELTVALHYVFDTPRDKLVWDVGHQAHFHKILTGRREKMSSQRQADGISGFLRRSESVYDPFGAGHSSTSISAALGMEVGRTLQGKHNKVIAVIGDGAMSAGMAFEAINNAGYIKNNLIVILNDNQMSIAEGVGALHSHLRSMRQKSFFKKTSLFKTLGLKYQGPIDGHNMKDLLKALKSASKADGPILLHVVTQKGKGFYSPNGGEKENFHAVNKFCPETCIQEKASAVTYTKVFAQSLIREARKDPAIVAITAAMSNGTGLELFQKEFKDRFFDVGIAEQHAVTFAAGLACENMKPFVAIYSTFLQRAYDQVIHDIAIQNLPVRFAIDRCGFVGPDGATHAGSFDLAYLGVLPNFVVMAPSDENELSHMVATAAAYNEGPIAFRYPKHDVTGVKIESPEVLEIGKGRVIVQGNHAAILSIGTRLHEALKAAQLLNDLHNIQVTVADARFAKPIDQDLVRDLATNHKLLITIEESSIGGFATHVNNFILQQYLSKHLKVKNFFFPDEFIEHGNVYDLYDKANLNARSIVAAIMNELNISNVVQLFKVG
jgi:1-deoxy-D-xylulose-5-phosphate synthase